jgi:hypothetical protein
MAGLTASASGIFSARTKAPGFQWQIKFLFQRKYRMKPILPKRQLAYDFMKENH